MAKPNGLFAVGMLAAVALIGSSCATKKYVREQVTPVEQRASELAKKNADAISQLEEKTSKEVSRVEERAMTAENKATAAGRAAEQAQQSANQANQQAQNARQMAEQNQSRLSEVANFLQNADKYKLVSSEAILFGFDRSNLTPEATQKLDEIAQNVTNMDRYVVEIEGFTDRTGPRDYNLALSRRRADAVVRYLVSKNIPLRRIHMLGLGEQVANGGTTTTQAGMETQQPRQPERETRETRKQARRVEVKIYAPEVSLQASATPPPAGTRPETTTAPQQNDTTKPPQ